jgi:hypothetical protein
LSLRARIFAALALLGSLVSWNVIQAVVRTYERQAYDEHAPAAHGNRDYQNLYESRRSGVVVTVVGTANSNSVVDRDGSEMLGLNLHDLKGSATVDITGTPFGACNGDYVVATGTYHYTALGGWIEVAKPEDVFVTSYGRSRFGHVVIFPMWCGGF